MNIEDCKSIISDGDLDQLTKNNYKVKRYKSERYFWIYTFTSCSHCWKLAYGSVFDRKWI